MLSRFLGRERLHAKNPDTSSPSKPLVDTFFEHLRKTLPDCFIFPNQSLSSILEKHPLPHLQATSLQNLHLQNKHLHFHFTVLDNQGKLLCLINLLTNTEQEKASEQKVKQLLSELNIRYLTWDKDQLPNESELAKAFPMYLHSSKTYLENTSQHFSRFKSSVEQHHGSPYLQQHRQQENLNLSISLSHLEKLAPNQHIKTQFPHIWQHICMYSQEPTQLKLYLNSLFEQNRPTKRKGFPIEVEQEICFIREEADRLTSKSS